MSSTIIAVFINLLVTLLPLIGIDTNSEQLNTTIQTIVSLVTGVWIWIQRTRLKSVGVANSDVNALGLKK